MDLNTDHVRKFSSDSLSNLTSHVLHLLGTRFIPTDTDVAIVQGSVQYADEQIRAINAEIGKLTLKRDQLQQFRDVHTALMAPIRRLPDELLSVIFELCSPQPVSDPASNFSPLCPPLPSQAPLLLAQICREWRRVAVSTARLWSSIVSELGSTPQESLASTWLLRSASCPLRISLASSDFGSGLGYDADDHPLLQHSRRWQEADFSITPCQYRGLGSIKGQLPMLQKLRITGFGRFQLVNVFACAPRLRNIFLEMEPSFIAGLPWDQITECTLSVSVGGCLDALRQMTRLVSCRLQRCIKLEDGTPISPVVSHLHSLVLRDALNYLSP